MFIPNPNTINVGDTVELVKEVKTFRGVFTVGHRFIVNAQGERGFDLVDEDGHELLETALIADHYKKVGR